MKKFIPLFLLLLLLTTNAYAKVIGQPIDYKDGDAALEGYLAYDDEISGQKPAVIVVPEWHGLNDYAKSRAEQLAALGYVGFAIDMYGKGIQAEDHEEAAQLSGVYRNDRNLMRVRAKAALDTLKTNPLVDTSKIAAIGYCFGGTTVLEMARAGFDLRGVASFHGALDTPMPVQPGDIKAKILVLQGGADVFTLKGLPGFKDEMQKAGADWNVVEFEGAAHSFTVPSAGNDPSTGKAYHADADKRSWEMLKDFLKEIFK